MPCGWGRVAVNARNRRVTEAGLQTRGASIHSSATTTISSDCAPILIHDIHNGEHIPNTVPDACPKFRLGDDLEVSGRGCRSYHDQATDWCLVFQIYESLHGRIQLLYVVEDARLRRICGSWSTEYVPQWLWSFLGSNVLLHNAAGANLMGSDLYNNLIRYFINHLKTLRDVRTINTIP